MDTKIIQQLIFEADKADSLGAVRKSLKELRGAMIAIGDEGSNEFQKLAAAAKGLKDKVDDANEAIDRTDPGKFNGLAAAANIAATGIQLTTGAMQLFGDESEDVQKALLKVQSAMMFAQGLQTVKELDKDFIKLGHTIKANPILAIATALIAIGAATYSLYENYQKLHTVSGRLNELNKEINATSVEAAKNAAVERNNLDNLYKSATDLNTSLEDRHDAVLKLQETYPLTFENFTDEEIALGKAKEGYEDLSESILATAMVKAKQALLDKKAMEFAGQEQEDLEAIRLKQIEANNASDKNRIEGMAANTRNAKKEALAELDVLKAKLENKRKIFQEENANLIQALKIDVENSKLAMGNIALAKTNEGKKDVSGAKSTADEKVKIAEDEAKRKQEILERYRQQNTDADFLLFEKFKTEQDEYLKYGAVTQAQYAENLQKEHDRIFGTFEAIVAKAGNNVMVVQELVVADMEKKLTRFQSFNKKLSSDNGQFALQTMSSVFSSMADLSGKHAKIQKGFAIGQTTIDTYVAAQKAFNSQLIPGDPTAPIRAYIAAGAAILSGFARVRSILAVDPMGGGGGGSMGGGVGSPPNLAAINSAPQGVQPVTPLDANGNVLQQQNQQPLIQRVYVLESDITQTQNSVEVTENAMRFQ